MARGKVVDRDRGYKRLRAWFRSEGRRRGSHVLVGLRSEGPGGGEHGGGGLTVAEIGSVHEFGLGTAPERSFIRASFDANADAYVRLATQLSRRAVDSPHAGAVRFALQVLGERALADIIRRINAGIPPALAEATVARKGSSKQLIDTGQLKQSLDFKVVL